MNEAGISFKKLQGRDSRGRIIHYDYPIYVVTDTDTIVSSIKVYFRQMPEEVLQLRQKFPEVHSLLSSYQLLHSSLDIAELEMFFREQTHVQSIDYNQICREIFLPRVCTELQTPPKKEELIAYTQLLQKGPEVHVPIWVVAKKGNFKHSNEVFLGTEYSPSEDWEKNARYSLQIDFLSAEYLSGDLDKDVSVWKKFFISVGVHERGDSSYVEEFAMAFVEIKLASRLTDFIRKDRQQHGYDKEARPITNLSSLVYLEIKGQKSEHAVELVGKEPQAAKSAKKDYWLCVVPGIPEYPQLWLVEDPSAVGDLNTITIDISKWKTSGRRVD